MDGLRVTFRCRVLGQPMPDIKWYKNGEEIRDHEAAGLNFTAAEDGTQSLTIGRANFNDVGIYRCEATNRCGSTWSETPLTIQSLYFQLNPRFGNNVTLCDCSARVAAGTGPGRLFGFPTFCRS